mmetsp:Transcript_153822/g.493263  ORF Transcript_153822/g.493263 Transcript_153822/m.493263 type:complete len:102 (+) Transcript_153822:1117-1422(+)
MPRRECLHHIWTLQNLMYCNGSLLQASLLDITARRRRDRRESFRGLRWQIWSEEERDGLENSWKNYPTAVDMPSIQSPDKRCHSNGFCGLFHGLESCTALK